MNQKITWEVIVSREGELASVLVEADGLDDASAEALSLYPGWSFVMGQSRFNL